MKINIKCPYCKKLTGHGIEWNPLMAFHPVILNCDCESGGCDKNFAVLIDMQPIVKTFTLQESK